MSKHEFMISVICPIYNEEKYIEKCIDSVLRQDYPKGDMEVLFVDGMSTDRTREIVAAYGEKYPFIRLLDNPRRIVPYAMNTGIQAARGEVIIRLDAHASYPENYFSELVTQLEKLGADNVGAVCRTLPTDDSLKCRAIAAALSSAFGMGNSYFRIGAKNVMQVDTVPFGCYRKEVFERIGLYDPDLVRNQDDELNARLIKHGGKIYLLPYLVVDYYARDTVKKVRKMFYQYGLFKPLVNKKLGAPATVRQFFPLCFVSGLIAGGILSLFSKVVFYLYLGVIALYVALAFAFALRDTKDLRQACIEAWVFVSIHVSYGWGYLRGIWKIVTGQSFTAKVNR